MFGVKLLSFFLDFKEEAYDAPANVAASVVYAGWI